MSIFSQSAERAAWAAPNGIKKGATFFLVFRCLNHTASPPTALNGVQKGQVHSKKHKPSKNIFVHDRLRGHHPRASISVNNPRFDKAMEKIYPSELTLKDTPLADGKVVYLDRQIEIRDRQLVMSLYDKRNDFPFAIQARHVCLRNLSIRIRTHSVSEMLEHFCSKLY